MKKIFLFAFLAVSAATFAQTVPNKLSFQKGQKFEVYTQLNRSSSQELMGQNMESSVTSAITASYDINDVVKEEATIESKIRRIKFDMSMMGREENFDSDNKDDLNSDMGKMIGKALDSKYTLTINPQGVVTNVKEDESAKKDKADPAAGMMGMMMGGMNTGGAPKVGDPSLFKILPDKAVAKGESWTEDTKDASGTRKTTYTVTDITATEVLLNFVEESTLETKQEIMGNEAAISVKAKSNGTITLDKASGILKQKTFVTNSKENISAGGMTIPSTSKMTTTITVKPI
jgi:hypothetical protein